MFNKRTSQLQTPVQNKTVSLEQVVKTHRFVNSHYGFHKLPSYFLTFSVK